jgi:hypothetical protein
MKQIISTTTGVENVKYWLVDFKLNDSFFKNRIDFLLVANGPTYKIGKKVKIKVFKNQVLNITHISTQF